MAEDRVRHILTDEKLSEVKDFLEKNRAIDCIFLKHLNKGRWRDAKEFMKSIDRPMDDGTFRSRMMELEFLLGPPHERFVPLKKYYEPTKISEILAELLLDFFEKLEDRLRKM